jgi:SAM-dependent methyltransferase
VSSRPQRESEPHAEGGPRPQPGAPPFEVLAGDYDRLRPADGNWLEVVDAMWEECDLAGRRVLDLGCGTGRIASALAARGARVWGVDPSAAMLEQARARCGRSVGLKLGRAEELPFGDGWFERLVVHLVVHLVDRGRAFPEFARVLARGGRVVIATFAPSHFGRIWLARYFPSLPELDRQRFVHPARLADELVACGFGGLRLRHVGQEARVGRADALERIRGRFISTLWLLSEEEYRAGLERAERELPEVTTYTREWTLVSGELR